jgi:hypothetical protein
MDGVINRYLLWSRPLDTSTQPAAFGIVHGLHHLTDEKRFELSGRGLDLLGCVFGDCRNSELID